MKSEVQQAVYGSIAKWAAVVAGGEDQANRNCPLCTRYYAGGCIGCPVKKESGQRFCLGTPYETWDDHHQRMHPENSHINRKTQCPTCMVLAKKEVKFLISLLPK